MTDVSKFLMPANSVSKWHEPCRSGHRTSYYSSSLTWPLSIKHSYRLLMEHIHYTVYPLRNHWRLNNRYESFLNRHCSDTASLTRYYFSLTWPLSIIQSCQLLIELQSINERFAVTNIWNGKYTGRTQRLETLWWIL